MCISNINFALNLISIVILHVFLRFPFYIWELLVGENWAFDVIDIF